MLCTTALGRQILVYFVHKDYYGLAYVQLVRHYLTILWDCGHSCVQMPTSVRTPGTAHWAICVKCWPMAATSFRGIFALMSSK